MGTFINKKWMAYFLSFSIVSICTIIGFALFQTVDSNNLIMLYFLGVVLVAFWSGIYRGPGILAALLSTAAFDYYFIPPYLSFSVDHAKYIFTLLVMLIVAQIINYLTISIRKQTESRLKAEDLAETEKFRNTLLLSISHDLRTPLAAIIGSASTLIKLDDKLNSETRLDLLHNIQNESERLNRFILNVLQVIRLESNATKITKQLHSIEEMIHISRPKFSRILENKNFSLDIEENIPLIYFDPILLEHVFINLIDNANKFSPPQSVIKLEAKQNANKVLISISNQSNGVHPEDTKQIFEKFYRGKNCESTGLGLGLAICKGIIQLHGGEIWSENLDNNKIQFCFALPMVTDDA